MRCRVLLTLILVCGSLSCTVDDDVVTDIGVTRIYFVDSDIDSQTLGPEPTRQVAKWAIHTADLELSGRVLDLKLGEICTFEDTVAFPPIAKGKCEGGMVIDSNEGPLPVTLTLDFTMQVRRAVPPFDLRPEDDHDGDRVVNGVDNCPLLPNPDQSDDNLDGIGNVCSVESRGVPVLDSDGDRVSDANDNCLWVYNPLQENTLGLTSKGTPDGIGDACDDQSVEVSSRGSRNISATLTLEGEEGLVQPKGEISLITVDLNGSVVCDWDVGTCSIDDPDAIRICTYTNSLLASFGCPEPGE